MVVSSQSDVVFFNVLGFLIVYTIKSHNQKKRGSCVRARLRGWCDATWTFVNWDGIHVGRIGSH